MPHVTTILLVRHTDVHNPREVVYGRLPRFALSTIGREEAARTARYLRDEPLAAVYSSPQLRARQTALVIAAEHPGLQVRVSRLLAEVRTSWEGAPNSELAARHYNFYEPLREPTDETLNDLAARMLRWLSLMLSRHGGQAVVSVSHADPIMVVRVLLTGLPLSLASLRVPEFYPTKGSVTRLSFTGRGDPRELPVEVEFANPSQTVSAV